MLIMNQERDAVYNLENALSVFIDRSDSDAYSGKVGIYVDQNKEEQAISLLGRYDEDRAKEILLMLLGEYDSGRRVYKMPSDDERDASTDFLFSVIKFPPEEIRVCNMCKRGKSAECAVYHQLHVGKPPCTMADRAWVDNNIDLKALRRYIFGSGEGSHEENV